MKNKALGLIAMLTVLVSAGCKKSETASAPTPAPEATAPAAAPAVAAAPVVVHDVNQSFTEVDSALRTRNYDTAVRTLLAVQQKQGLTPEQVQEAANRMKGLQANLAAAVAAGDPSARAAADALRRSHTY
jgi:hypothetical protein